TTYSAIPGGYGLRFDVGGGCFGYNSWSSSYQDSATVSDAHIAYLGNVDLWLGNTRNQPSKLKFFTAQATGGAFPLGTTYYSSFEAGVQTANLTYTLPTAYPTGTGRPLTSSTTGTMSWGVQTFQLLNQNLVCGNIPGDGGTVYVDIAVTGAVIGSTVTVSPRDDMEDGIIIASARVSAADVVRIKLVNATGGIIDPNDVAVDITIVQP
ncbi:MAG: hypothetical protein HYZ54_09380, partial [Ignavibacteriae bacterium]|nr:hypothetical protein [Ignavibacteriota bacterium]